MSTSTLKLSCERLRKWTHGHSTVGIQSWFPRTNQSFDLPKCLKEGMEMNLLYVLAVVLVILWLVGFLTATLGGLIHILLVLAIIAVLLRVIRGRKALGG